jgi:hypothetical protein
MTSFDFADRVVSSYAPSGEVEVRTRFDGRWSPGFEVVSVDDDSCRVRRRSDGVVLPASFRAADVRPLRPR